MAFLLDSNITKSEASDYHLLRDFFTIIKKEEIWLCAIIILTGYQLFFATYSISAYFQNYQGLTAVAVGWITVAKLWMRPIGAVAGGFAADFLDREKTMMALLVVASIALIAMTELPAGSSQIVLLFIVLLVGVLTYAVRGVYWATLETAQVSNRIKGLAIGFISLVAFSPDIYLPALEAKLAAATPGRQGADNYFLTIAVMGFIGALAAWRLQSLAARQRAASANKEQ